MERLIAFWHNLSIEQLTITLLICAVLVLFKMLRDLNYRYAQLDKLTLLHGHIISHKFGIRTVRLHRSGNYEVAQPLNQE